MKKLFTLLFVAIALIGCEQEKTAYVDTTRLIQDYQEMKDVEAEFEVRSTALKAELDSIGRGFQAEVQEYQAQAPTLSESEREQRGKELMQQQQQLQQQQQIRSQQLRQESGEAIDTLVSKVKDFVADYGERNNYTYIFGSNETANIMYAKEGLDITDEILVELNEAYKEE